jgi:hypothetical protein
MSPNSFIERTLFDTALSGVLPAGSATHDDLVCTAQPRPTSPHVLRLSSPSLKRVLERSAGTWHNLGQRSHSGAPHTPTHCRAHYRRHPG